MGYTPIPENSIPLVSDAAASIRLGRIQVPGRFGPQPNCRASGWRRHPIPRRQSRQPWASFDHLVGAVEERGRHTETERLRGLEIDDQLELGRLLDWQVCRVGPFQDLINVGGGTPEQVGTVYPI